MHIWGNLAANVERLDDEHFKSLQVIDPHTHKYLERMQDEPLFLALAQRVRTFVPYTLATSSARPGARVLSQPPFLFLA